MPHPRKNLTHASLLMVTLALPTTITRASTSGELKLLPDDGVADSMFGASVGISGDLAIVGAYLDDANSINDSGAAYLYHAASGQQLYKLSASDGDYFDWFGSSAAISGDLAIVGAIHADLGYSGNAGAAYVFDTTTGLELRKLIALDARSGDNFGCSVSISGDLVAVGALMDNDLYSESGSAYTFNATTGYLIRKLEAQDPATNDHLGCSVSISGELVLVGAFHDDDHGHNSGSAYTFDAISGWQQLKLTPQDGQANDWFGCSVSLSDGRALIGACRDDDNGLDSGSAYVFDALTGTQLYKLTAHDGAAGDEFGCSVFLSGNRAIVGAKGDDDHGGDSGSAYIFDASTGQRIAKLTAHDGDASDSFGVSVSISEDLSLVGAELDEDNGFESGSAYLFGNIAPNPGVGFCFGDPGSGAPCPCNNDNDGSVPGSGCDNGYFTSGAELFGVGVASVSNDYLRLTTLRAEPYNTGLYFQANNRINGGDGIPFGDGLRCAGFGLIRLEVRVADPVGTASTTIAIGTKGGVTAGDTKRYQYWYRTTAFPPCGHGVNDFNLTNGYEVTWLP